MSFTPPNKAYKYKGKSFERDLESIKTDTFWCPLKKDLNDPNEGFVDAHSIKDQIKNFAKLFVGNNLPSNVAQSMVDLYEAIDEMVERPNKVGIFSLSTRPDIDLAWSHYADGHRGFCIEYDTSELTKLLPSNLFHWIPIKYSSNPPVLDIQDIIKMKRGGGKIVIQKILGYKSISWDYEKEIRLINDNPFLNNHSPNAITSIYFGINLSNEKQDLIRAELKDKNVKYYQMQLKKSGYGTEAIEVN